MVSNSIDPYKAAKQGQSLKFSLPLAKMERWCESVLEPGSGNAELEFNWGDQRRLLVTGRIEVNTSLRCERCLGPMPWGTQIEVRGAVVWSDEQAARLPAELDPWMGEEERLDLNLLVEDELLLALPIMSVHDPKACGGASRFATEAVEEIVEKRKPLADLGSLINKGSN